MAGLLLIALMIGYVALTIWLLIKVKPIWAKALVLTIAILIPTADDIYYRRQLDEYCEKEAGLKINQTVSKKEGLLLGHNVPGGIRHPDYLKLVNVSFVEFYKEGVLYRHERQANGSIKTGPIPAVTATYEYFDNERMFPSDAFLETELIVIDQKSNRILGQQKNLNYYGGWYRRILLGGLADSGPVLVDSCGISEEAGRYELVNKIFSES